MTGLPSPEPAERPRAQEVGPHEAVEIADERIRGQRLEQRAPRRLPAEERVEKIALMRRAQDALVAVLRSIRLATKSTSVGNVARSD